MQVVANLRDPNSKVDRMWELLVEIVLFARTGKHRNPIEILKSFIRADDPGENRITKTEERSLRALFCFLLRAYKNKELSETRLATNQIHFYTMITSIVAGDLLHKYSEDDLIRRLSKFGQIIDKKTSVPGKLVRTVKLYRELSEKQTTHVSRRMERQGRFLEAIQALTPLRDQRTDWLAPVEVEEAEPET